MVFINILNVFYLYTFSILFFIKFCFPFKGTPLRKTHFGKALRDKS